MILLTNEIISKSFTAFLAKIPGDYKGVDRIEMTGTSILIKEKNTISRDITLNFNHSIQ
jgi:hypothetical protein